MSDSNNNNLRVITPLQVVTTLAGGGAGGTASGSTNGVGTNALFDGPQGVALDAATGVIFVADTSNSLIRALTPSSASASPSAAPAPAPAGGASGAAPASSSAAIGGAIGGAAALALALAGAAFFFARGRRSGAEALALLPLDAKKNEEDRHRLKLGAP